MKNAFSNVIGYESVKEELYQLIDIFNNIELYVGMGARLPKGLILFGRPGTGKTTLVNALIKACKVPTYYIKKDKNDNETLADIKETFHQASLAEPSIVFIDDIDKLSERSDPDCDDKSFVAIQTAMDSVKDKNVLVVATANFVGKLPSSLRRNGRFDRQIRLECPSNDDARKIIEFYMKSKRVDENLNYDDVAAMISYSSCADLETILNESAIQACYARKAKVDIEDIVKAYLRDEYLSPDASLKFDSEEIEKTALHEAGHVVVAEVLKKGSVGFVHVSDSGNNMMQGFTHLCEIFKRRPEQTLVALGGKVATELFYEGRCASGCHDDLEKAANLIRDGISESGTCGVGMIDVANHRFPQTSESMNARNEAVVQAELERNLFLVRDIMIKNKDFLMEVKQKLEEKKYLLKSDLEAIRQNHTIIEHIVP